MIFGDGIPTGDFGGAYVAIASTERLNLNNSGGETVTLSGQNVVVIDAYADSSADDNQSITRAPDIIGPNLLVNHGDATSVVGALFSPGTKIDESPLVGYSSTGLLKQSTRRWLPKRNSPALSEAGLYYPKLGIEFIG